MTQRHYNRFTCLRKSLAALNLVYILISIGVISIAWFNHVAAVVTLRAYSGIIGCASFLILLSILGLVGALRHNQVCLFFYMSILFVVFIVQFSIACSLFAINKKQQEEIAFEGWKNAGEELRNETEIRFQCCGFSNFTDVVCASNKICCPHPMKEDCRCPPCWEKLQVKFEHGLTLVASIGILFSLSLLIGVWMTFCYRNTKDPKLSPNAFL